MFPAGAPAGGDYSVLAGPAQEIITNTVKIAVLRFEAQKGTGSPDSGSQATGPRRDVEENPCSAIHLLIVALTDSNESPTSITCQQ